MSEWTAAVDAFRGVVGGDEVRVEGEELRSAERTTFATTQQIRAIVRPLDRAQVQECVRIAREHQLPLYPIGSGKNWGYGSRVPVRTGCVLLDLGRMRKILEVNEELAYAVVEPGVTFRQLHAHLAERKSRLFAAMTGAIDGSVVGNALERGIGKGPNGDRYATLCNLEVVLGDASVIETGFSRYPNAKSAHLSRGSLGPHLDGMFTQSSFGIVTRMTVWLTPRPHAFQTYFYRINSAEQLPALVDVLRELRLGGVGRTPFLLANAYRFLSFTSQYPFEKTGGKTPLPEAVFRELTAARSLGAWGGDGALYSQTTAQARADRAYVESVLGPHVDQIEFWDADRTRAEEASPTPGRLAPDPAFAFTKSFYLGHPIVHNSLFSTYWRKKQRPGTDLDPDRDGCGFLSFSPAIPARGTDAVAAVRIATEVLVRHGFEPNLGLNFITERLIDVTGWLLWDREVEGEDARAAACHADVVKALADAGYYAYRLDIDTMDAMRTGGAYDALLRALKRTCDPDGILAPGRYDPAEH